MQALETRGAEPLMAEAPARPQRLPHFTLALTLAFFAFALLPRVQESPALLGSILGFGAALLAWQGILLFRARREAFAFAYSFAAIKAHYVQACVQGTIYLYWGWHAREVYAQMPLIAAQLVFLYALGGLLAWTRGRSWQIGFGPIPIIFSTNLLLWYRDDWFYLQFFMVALGALGKEFIQWTREGKKTHIFNPSVFGQSAFALVMILTGTTHLVSRGEEIASSFENLPHIISLIFLLGLVVQYNFSVTLMTLAAAGTLALINAVYTARTGVYLFVTLNIGATVFLGLHLLVTDPSTSPRSNTGRAMFGALYALGYTGLFVLFDRIGVPVFWDKLLPVPVLNLCVPAIDRMVSRGSWGRFNDWWEHALAPRRLNLLHMGCWAALFATILLSGFVEGRHEGRTLAFWRQAYEEERFGAADNFRRLVLYRAREGNAEACNMLGKLHLEGNLVPKDEAAAAHWFAKACRAGYAVGCENVAGLLLFEQRAQSQADALHALESVEAACGKTGDGANCFLAGYAYEIGNARPKDAARAMDLYAQGARRGHRDAAKGLARVAIANRFAHPDLASIVPMLEKGGENGDAECSLYLGFFYRLGLGVPQDEQRARVLLEKGLKK